ncbi:MAG TPA: amino acid adenylation domain-containing protein, partial [Niastella sp.]
TGRLYRTGDIGKYRHDGNIEFLGRTDDQVKIRGHRIELGEIEHVLMQFPGIQTAIVIDLTDEQGDKRLFAYLLLSGQQIDLKALKVFAEKKLPVYMVPAGFAVLDQLPLTSSGKADKKALMAMGGSPMLSNSYQAPGNDLEQKLCTIWENILQVKQVGVRDNLFELGGHSLTIIRMIAAIRRQLTLEVSIPDIFSHPTVESLAAHLQGHNTKGGIQQLSARTTSSPIPLSFGQERIWFVHKMEGSVAYHIPALFRIKGALSDQSLSYALQSVIERHDVLRTVFVEKDGVPYQQLIDTNNWQLKVWDYGSISEASLKENLRQLIVQPFDLAGDYMLKAHLIKLQPGEHLLLIIIHHIAADGWSLPVILRDVVQSYSAHVKGVQKELPPLKIRYADFAIWQRNNLAAEALNEKIKYWKNKLDGVVPLQLPTDKARPAIQTTRGANLVLRIDKELNDKIHQLATKQQSTVFMTLLAIMKVLLSRYSNQNDISIGVPVAGRMFEELEQLAGFFVNTLVLRTKIDVETSFQELLKQITNETIEAYEYQHTPFEKIVEAVVKERDMSRHPLFQVMFAYENYDVDRPALLQLPGLAVNGEALPGIASKFDCTFNFQQLEHELLVTLEYNADLFEQTTMKRILGHFVKLMQEVTSNPLQPIASLQLLNEAERHQLLHEFNSTTAVYPQQKTITALFEEQVMRTPEKTAVVFEDRSLTYRQLNERANQLAHYLRNEYGVGADDRVALLLDRSEWMIVSILGVLKAGGAYVPVDPQYPAERISYILNDCNAKVLITHTDHLFLIENYAGGILAVDVQMDMLNTPVDQPVAVHDPFNLAYVIYTSGSSGQPKGVMIEHRSLINTQYWRRQYYSFDDSFCFLLLPSFAFDSSVNDVFSSLLIGGQLVIVKEENLFNVKALIALLIEHKVSHFNAVPALYNALLDSWEPQNLFLKVITLAGEKLTAKLLQRHFSIFPHVPVINEYGPTENAICSTAVKITQPVEEDPVIGTPISNTRTYVLNSHLQLQPIGVPGELFLSGDGLARGYLNREELTNEKFITNPFKKERLYRTGDLVRRLPDGSLQFLGRVDDQVKIRGYRIEPGEIEAVLQQLAEVELAVVIMQQYNNAPVLAAYCVLKSDTDIEVIKQHVINRLPAAMVPSYIIPLQQMPLTPNGKVDKRALPPIHDNAVPGNKYVAPRTELEQKLCAIWEEVLQVKQVGIQDDFFKLGGHSLIVVKLLTCIENTFQVRLDISGIFKDPTIEGQAEQILFFLARKDQQQNKSELIEIDL